MDQVQTAGEFSVETCELISSKGITLDISSLLLEINLFEDIYSSAVQGSIVCVDSNSVISKTQIIGQDYIRLKLSLSFLANIQPKYAWWTTWIQFLTKILFMKIS